MKGKQIMLASWTTLTEHSTVEWMLGEQDVHRLHAVPSPGRAIAVIDHRAQRRLFLTRRRDIRDAFVHPDLSSSALLDASLGDCHPAWRIQGLRSWPLYTDGQAHQKARLATLQILRSQQESLDRRLRELVDEHLDRFGSSGSGDLMHEVLRPIAVKVALDILSLPSKDWETVDRWAAQIVQVIELSADREVHRAAEDAWRAFEAYLARVTDCTDPRTLANHSLSILLGATQTAIGLMGCAVIAMSEQEQALDIASTADFVEEVLRYYSPAKLTSRRAGEDLTIADYHVPRDTIVTLWLQFANRDGEAGTINRFDASGHAGMPHLGFGAGLHACPGAAIGRKEAIALVASLKRRGLVLHQVRWGHSSVLRIPSVLLASLQRK
jgi:cytochrome P450